jgi:hypothetical protein
MKYTILPQQDNLGPILGTYSNVSECLVQCNSNASCVGFSTTASQCVLKSGWGDVVDSNSDVYYLVPPPTYLSSVKYSVLPSSRWETTTPRIKGTVEKCKVKCDADPSCLGFNYINDGCTLHDEWTSVVSDPSSSLYFNTPPLIPIPTAREIPFTCRDSISFQCPEGTTLSGGKVQYGQWNTSCSNDLTYTTTTMSLPPKTASMADLNVSYVQYQGYYTCDPTRTYKSETPFTNPLYQVESTDVKRSWTFLWWSVGVLVVVAVLYFIRKFR